MANFVVIHNDTGGAATAVALSGSASEVLRADGTVGAPPNASAIAWDDVTGKPAFGTASLQDVAAFDAAGAAATAQGAAIAAAATDATTKANAARVTAAALGYATGAGGTVAQATSKATGVTLSKLSGEITLNAAALAAATIVSFTLTNTNIEAADVLVLNHVTTGTRGAYGLNAQCAAGSAVIYVRNNSAASLSEAIVIRFVLIKSVKA